MVITDIKQQVKKKDRCSIYIDGKFVFGMSQVDVLYYKLKIGDEISAEKYNYILTETVYDKAKEKAVSLLGHKGRSRRELFDRLSRDYSDDIAERVLAMLEKYGYIDDEKYAEMFVSDCVKIKKWGRRKIEFELKAKGVDAQTISAAIDKVFEKQEESQAECAAKLLERRLKGENEITYKQRQKHTAYLAGRGFDFDDINEAFAMLDVNVISDFKGD